MPHRFSILASFVGSGKTVLDIGCGEGILAKILEEKGNSVIGIDVSELAIDLARRNGVEAVLCDIENDSLPFADKFDVIILSEVLEHLIFPDKVLLRLQNYLKEEGYLILTFPNIAFYGYRLELLKGRFPKQHLYKSGEHIHHWSVPDFTEFAAKCCLKIVQLKANYSFPLHSIVSKFKPLVKVLERFPNLFGYQIVVCASYRKSM